MHNVPITSQISAEARKRAAEAESRKLLNVIYHDEKYNVMEPLADRFWRHTPDVLIDRKIWLVLRFLHNCTTEIKIGDMIRFGRVTFKITELVITPEEIESTQKALE